MSTNDVRYDVGDDGVATLTFDRPEVMNAIRPAMSVEILEAIADVRTNDAVRCLLITGEGRGFCSGANVADAGRRRAGGGTSDALRSSYHPLLLSMRDLDIPIVTAVNGAAAGIGMSFAIMGDMVCASKNAFFLQAFGRIGLVPDGGSTFLLPRMVGWSRAIELSLLA